MSDERSEKPLPEKASPEKTSLEKKVPEGAGPEPLPAMRASDADRERVVERLRDAVAEGRLDMEEFEERLEAAYTSRTYAELEPLTQDLPPVAGPMDRPVAPAASPGSSWPTRIGGTATSSSAVAVMSGFQRKGRWTVPDRFNALAFWGGGELDLREADFAAREVVITCVAIMGGIEITVPPGVEVDVRGIGIMGAFDQGKTLENRPEPGAPRVIVNGLAFWGGVEVKVKPPKGAKGAKGAKRLDGGTVRKEL